MKHFIFLSLIFISFVTVAQLPDEVNKEVKNRVDNQINPSIAIGIVSDAGVQYYSFGTKIMGGEGVNEHTIYEIGSISKTFTAILLAKAQEEGKVKIDDPVSKYVPGIPQRGSIIMSLGNLSDHTSALPRMPSNFAPADLQNPYADYTKEQLLSFVENSSLTRDVGSEYEYSNLAQGLLGNIVADQYGLSYEELMIKKIAAPLKMKETKITFDDKMKQNLALGHDNGVQVKNWDIPSMAGAGAIRSSTFDMIKYIQANMGLKKSKLYSAMQTTHSARHNKAGNMSVGLAWHIRPGDNGDIVWHNGGTGGYRAFAGFNPDTNTGVVVLTNGTESVDDIGLRLLDPDFDLPHKNPSITLLLQQKIETEGIDAALAAFKKAKEEKTFDIEEAAINVFGYSFMAKKDYETAKAIFMLNVNEYPNSSNVYDSYGEALMENGETEEAIINYRKSLDLNPGNAGAVEKLKAMGADATVKDVVVSEEILKRYVGKYQLAPSFFIDIFISGKQLMAQATGQQAFPIYPKSETEFYFKVVEANIEFTVDEGKTESLTLHQAGQHLPGKKIE